MTGEAPAVLVPLFRFDHDVSGIRTARMSAQITARPELGRLQSALSDSDRGGEAIALEILGAETAKAAAPAGDEPAFATEMAAEGVVELAHGTLSAITNETIQPGELVRECSRKREGHIAYHQ